MHFPGPSPSRLVLIFICTVLIHPMDSLCQELNPPRNNPAELPPKAQFTRHLTQNRETPPPNPSSPIPLTKTHSGIGQPSFSGIYPHLASFNQQNECGTGALVPWDNHLWWVTYAPHRPKGSDDLLYAMNSDRDRFIWPGSVGGTPANRMIHAESQQLIIGPYWIKDSKNIRVIPPERMPGRLTGTARHLFDPLNKVYVATMEEGFYEVEVQSLSVKELFPDANQFSDHSGSLLPGYHGKGLFSGQNRLIYANNGELSPLAMTRPDIQSGVLAQWFGEKDWETIRRNQFTEVSGPGGIIGNPNPETDPVWSIGWDHRSLLLMVLSEGKWSTYRLPKASHCYDGSHGWNTEWPRIRDIGEEDLLMTMHGMFWRFPRTFTPDHSQGIRPRSSYLKVIGDFCRWGNEIVLGCDDSARNEFLNKRKSKGNLAGPAVSQSNLWFIQPEQLDHFGPPIGRGAVWYNDEFQKDQPSDPYLFSGFERKSLHLINESSRPVSFDLEVDQTGAGCWNSAQQVNLQPGEYQWISLSHLSASWIRIRPHDSGKGTAWFEYRSNDPRGNRPSTPSIPLFDSLAPTSSTQLSGGLLRSGQENQGLQILATEVSDEEAREVGYYELKPDLKLERIDNPALDSWMKDQVQIPKDIVKWNGACMVFKDEEGQEYGLPLGESDYLTHPERIHLQRIDREVCTERDLFQCAGTFYELPARNAGGFSKIRPISTHPYFIQDYASWRGLLVLTGLITNGPKSPNVIASDDGLCRVWLGAVDDLWKLGKPRGLGGPWNESRVQAQIPSIPYLMTGFDRKSLQLWHSTSVSVNIRIEIDLSGTGQWVPYKTLSLRPEGSIQYTFPDDFQAYWVRLVSDQNTIATAQFLYE